MTRPIVRPLRMALIGGGGGFIGRIHVQAAQLDGLARLVAGALRSDPVLALAAGPAFGLDPARTYATWEELIDSESRLTEDQRCEFVAITTPNDTHVPVARAALEAGFHVVCEKPMAMDAGSARDLVRQVKSSDRVLVLMHTYSGYPLVHQARAMVERGDLGELLCVRATYLQGSGLRVGKPRAAWRLDPARAGPSGCMADIGTHAFHLARFVTGVTATRLSARMQSFHPDRPLDEHGVALVETSCGALLTVTASKVSAGRENALSLEIDGRLGSLVWRQEDPDQLEHRADGRPVRLLRRDPRGSELETHVRAMCRWPAGHPEGYLEAFANVYRLGLQAMGSETHGPTGEGTYPGVVDGLTGAQFVEACLTSSAAGGSSVAFPGPAHGDP